MSSLISVGIAHIDKCLVESSIIYKTIMRFLHIKIWKPLLGVFLPQRPCPQWVPIFQENIWWKGNWARGRGRERVQAGKEEIRVSPWRQQDPNLKGLHKNLPDLTHLSQSQDRKSTDRSQPPFQSSETNCWKETREKGLHDDEESPDRGLQDVT